MARLFPNQAAPRRNHETRTRYRRSLVWPRDWCRTGSNRRRCFAEFWRSVLRWTTCLWPTVLPALCAPLLLPPSRSCDRLRTALLPRATRDRRAAASSLRAPISSRLVGKEEHQRGAATPAPPFFFYIPAVRISRDHFLPPDPKAFLAGEPSTGRVIVIAPTRAACETIELALGLNLETLLEREHGEDIRRLAGSGQGFGIVAGTGTGKTLAIRSMAETILKAPLKVGVVNREREATPETPTWNVVIITTGIARRWFQDGLITAQDTRAVDEQIAKELGDRWPNLATAFYHGGEPIRVIRPFLDGLVKRPFLLAMTAAGQSALNIRGLDTVVIYDARYTNVVERGKNVLTRAYLGAN